MFEEILEDTAQTNGLREVNTYIKLMVGLGGIILCLLSVSYVGPLAIALLFTFAILVLAKIDLRVYLELFIAPFWFAVFSVAVIVLISGGAHVLWQWDITSWFSLSVTRESINEGFYIFCRVIGGMSSLLFIALTTPMTDLFAVMKRCRVPDIVIDLSMIIYRTIFILAAQIVQVYRAQVMRLGYSTWRESIHSFSSLAGSAFISSWNAGEDLIRAMDARCYDGKFAMLGESRPVECIPLAAGLSFLAVSALVIATTGTYTLM
ncbi:MAG: cobalt ECF transporter T component CbiQ [Methanoregulaceae archaeon]